VDRAPADGSLGAKDKDVKDRDMIGPRETTLMCRPYSSSAFRWDQGTEVVKSRDE
jgi:hypothetical protein